MKEFFWDDFSEGDEEPLPSKRLEDKSTQDP